MTLQCGILRGTKVVTLYCCTKRVGRLQHVLVYALLALVQELACSDSSTHQVVRKVVICCGIRVKPTCAAELVPLVCRWLLLRREAGGIEQRQKHVNVLMYGK